MGISLKPSEASAGGFTIDDVDVVLEKCRFRLWDYNGTIPNPILGLEVVYRDDEGGEATQVYSAGDTKHFVPSEDGSEAMQVGSLPTLAETTNAMAWMVSLVNAGFPEDKIGDKVSVFEGTRVHVNQVPQPKRKGLKNPGTGADKNILLVSKIHTYPWDPKAGKTGPKAAAPKAPVAAKAAAPAVAGTVAKAVAPAAPAADAGELNGLAMETLLGKGGAIPKAQIAQEAFKALATHPQRNALVQMVYKDEFLKQDGAPWLFDGTTVSMPSE